MYINHIRSYVEQIYVHKSYMYVEINAINKKIFFDKIHVWVVTHQFLKDYSNI